MTARFLATAPDGVRVAQLDRVELHRSVVSEIATVLRHGVPARRLDGLRAYRDVDALRLMNATEARAAAMQTAARDARRRADVQLRAAEDCQSPEEEKAVRELARKHLRDASRLEHEIAALEKQRDTVELAESFSGEVDYLLAGLSALASEDGLIDSDVAHALRSVLRDFTIRVEQGAAHWQLCLLVPCDGGVVSLGPISGRVPLRGLANTAAHLARPPAAGAAKKTRERDLKRLKGAGYSTLAARVAVNAPHHELVAALVGDEPPWEATRAGFDAPRFHGHLCETYHALTSWNANTYCLNNRSRQAFVNYVAEAGGSVTLRHMRDAMPSLGLKQSAFYALLDGRTTSSGNVIPPALRRDGVWGTHRRFATSALITSILCPRCGLPATAASLIPEVPGGLLCRTCLVAPAQPTLVFPDIYAEFSLPGPA